MEELPRKRTNIVNHILSKGRVIITDRLHASIASVLMGKQHVIVQDKFKKIENVREAAFGGKSECSSENIHGYYASSIEQAVDIAIRLLDSSLQNEPQSSSLYYE